MDFKYRTAPWHRKPNGHRRKGGGGVSEAYVGLMAGIPFVEVTVGLSTPREFWSLRAEALLDVERRGFESYLASKARCMADGGGLA